MEKETIDEIEETCSTMVCIAVAQDADLACLLSAQRKFIEAFMWMRRATGMPKNNPWPTLPYHPNGEANLSPQDETNG